MDPLDSLIAGAKLQSFPAVLARLNQLFSAQAVGTPELAAVVQTDTALSASLLRIANSEQFGMPQRVFTPEDAFNRCGIPATTALLNAAVVEDIYQSVSPALISPEDFWSHSVGTAILAEHFARELGIPDPQRLYLGGIFHELGLLIILCAAPDAANRLYADRLRDPQVDLAAEQGEFCHSRGAIGAHLINKWKFPPVYAACAEFAYHGEPKSQYADVIKALRWAVFTQGLAPDKPSFWHSAQVSSPPIELQLRSVGRALAKREQIINNVRALL